MENRRDIIAELSPDLSPVGCGDLRGAVALASERDIDGVEHLNMGVIAEEVAYLTNRKPRTVSKSLARITSAIWESGNKEVWKELYNGRLPSSRPTPKNFIIRLAYFVKKTQKYTGGALTNMYRYELYQMRSPASRNSYGILAKESLNGVWVTVAVAAGFSNNREDVFLLAEKCTELQLSPEHLIDVVSDFISQAAIDT